MTERHPLTAIILDTNFIFASGDNGFNFTQFNFNSKFDKVLDFIEKNDLIEFIYVLLPEVVYEEKKKHQITEYQKQIEKFKTMLENYTFRNIVKDEILSKFDTITEYENELDKLMSNQKEKISKNIPVKIIFLSIPLDLNVFNNIIKKAFNKIAPFEGKDTKSDKGFKDCLLWESILSNSDLFRFDKVYLVSNDGRFHEQYLFQEYKDKFNKDITISKDIDDVLDNIKKEYKDLIADTHDKESEIDEKIAELLLEESRLRDTLVSLHMKFDSIEKEQYKLYDILNIEYDESKLIKELEKDFINYYTIFLNADFVFDSKEINENQDAVFKYEKGTIVLDILLDLKKVSIKVLSVKISTHSFSTAYDVSRIGVEIG